MTGFPLKFNAAEFDQSVGVQPTQPIQPSEPSQPSQPSQPVGVDYSNHPAMPNFVPQTEEDRRVLERTRANVILMEQRAAAPSAPVVKPRPIVPCGGLIPSQVPTPPAKDLESTKLEIFRLIESLTTAPAAESSSPFATGLFKGKRITFTVDTPAERESMAYLVNLLREAGAKVGFTIGAEAVLDKTRAKVTSFATSTGKARIQESVIRQLKTPILKALAERPRTLKELQDILGEGGYTHNTYFKINQMLHLLGCQKTTFSNPEVRGPSYVWALPTAEVAE